MNNLSHKYITIAFLLFIGISLTSNGQTFLSTNGQAIVNEEGDTIILRGMGLGGWMVQEGYMLQTAEFANPQHQIREKIEELIGTTDTELFYDAWLANHVRKIDIDSLKSWGFNSVRLPMHYNLFTLPIEDEPVAGENTWLDKGFELTDSLISWCVQNEMYVILDLHAAPGGQGYDQGISDYDPDKPSLWESSQNRDKTVALWTRIADRYKNEPYIAGYDLINEPNWNMTGNAPLRNLYEDITDGIRSVDTKHIIFIEGNWFANDFTGLTPPWDDNIVYSPHKYWSINDQASIQWVLDLREEHNVPLYLGESGENSNVWFRDAIHLLESHGIGWAWWPMKKIEAIAGPLSVEKTTAYENLLNYWKGTGGTINASTGKATLMELTELLKMENCFYQKDVIDAMFRQVYSDEAKPYNTQTIPGVVYASDYDMGREGIAYSDRQTATYHVSTGNYTAWNNGWAYRNDGVDIEPCQDDTNTNGYNIGWTEEGEWMQYDVNVEEDAVYEVHIRFATSGSSGRFHLSANGSDVSTLRYVPNTGGYQNWTTAIVPNVVLTTEDNKLRFYSDGSDYNVSSFEFISVGATTSIETNFLKGETQEVNTVEVVFNKPLAELDENAINDFELLVNGLPVLITDMELNAMTGRSIVFTVDHTFNYNEVIRMNYTGNQVLAQDGSALVEFTFAEIINLTPQVHPVPGRIEAENFSTEVGINTQNVFDTGGGKQIRDLDIDDYIEYHINVGTSGLYTVDYRVAAESESGQLQMHLMKEDGTMDLLQTANFSPTGDWQTWETFSHNLSILEGQHKIRLTITKGQFNLNWFEFNILTSLESVSDQVNVQVYPNPSVGQFAINATLKSPQDIQLEVYNLLGKTILTKTIPKTKDLQETIDLSSFSDAYYLLSLQTDDGTIYTKPLIKLK